MNRAAVTLLAVAITVPLTGLPAAAQDDPGSVDGGSTDTWEPWFNESHTVRVPLSVEPGDGYPEEWDGPRLVVYELDTSAALEAAGWPTNRGKPVDFSLEADSLRVVPRGVEDPEPVSAVTWDGPLVGDDTSGEVATLAFLAPEGVDGFHVYFDRVEDGTEHHPLPDDPVAEQRVLQLLAGPGAGHELVGPVRGSGTLLVGGAYPTDVLVEERTSEGWTAVSCSGSVVDPASPSSWPRCQFSTGSTVHAVRVTADRPVAAYAWPDDGVDPQIPLASDHGTPDGTRLVAPAPSEETRLNLMALGEPCQADVGGSSTTVGSGSPTTLEIRNPELVEADCDIIGWTSGRGPAPLPVAANATLTESGFSGIPETGGTTNCPVRGTLVAVGDSSTSVTRLDTSQQQEEKRILSLGTPSVPGHDGLRAADWSPADAEDQERPYRVLNEDGLVWPSLWDPRPGALPLAPTPDGSINWLGPVPDDCADRGLEARLASVPFSFEGQPRVDFHARGQPIGLESADIVPISETLSFSPEARENTEIPSTGGLVEASLAGNTPGLTPSFALVDPSGNEGDAAPSSLAAHMEPMEVEEGEAQAIGPLLDIDLEPTSQIAAPGTVTSFDVVGEGFERSPDGTITPISVALNADTSTASDAPELGADLGRSEAELPVDAPETITTLTVDVPGGIEPGSNPAYDVTVTGTPVDGGNAIPARATLQVIPDRELSLTFEDGSKVQDLQTEDGKAEADLLLSNEGTATEDVDVTATVPPALDWEVTVEETATGEPIPGGVIEGLEPGEEVPLTLDVRVPGDETRVVEINVDAQSTEDGSVTSEVTARVAHGVDVDVVGTVEPDLVTMQQGDSRTLNLSLVNHGSEVSVGVRPDTGENLVLESAENTVNLGPEGSQAANATVPLNLTVDREAPLNTVLVGTVTLEIGVGELEPVESLLSLRVRVLPEHAAVPLQALDIQPGVPQQAEVSVRAEGDGDEDLALSLRGAPEGWTVEPPERLRIPHNATAPLRLNVTPPSGTPPGAYDLALRGTPADATDPIEIRLQAIVPETPAFQLSPPAPVTTGLGANETLPLTIENRGNQPGETTIQGTADHVEATARPATVTMAPGEERSVELLISATDLGNGTLTLTAPPSGNATLPVRVGSVDFGVNVVSTTPAQPAAGEPFRAVASVTNSGNVQATDVDVSLMAGDEPLQTERIARLDPGSEVSLTLAVDELSTTSGLALEVDPFDRYTQADGTDTRVSLESDDTPMPPAIALVAALTALAAALRRRR